MLLKKILVYHFLPILIALGIGFTAFKKSQHSTQEIALRAKNISGISYVEKFEPYDLTNQLAFSLALKQSVPILMGSSELTSGHLTGLPQNFFTREKGSRFLSFGHAGFQSLAILTVLAANVELLKEAKITIILSPGWFEKQYCKGTSLSSFFEYATPNYLQTIRKSTVIDKETKAHIQKYISRNFDQISSPDATLRLLSQKAESTLSSIINLPFTYYNEQLIKYSTGADAYLDSQNFLLAELRKSKEYNYVFKMNEPNWDSLERASSKEFKRISNNNDIAVENSYFSKWLTKGKKKNMIAVEKKSNQEFKDLQALVHFFTTNKLQPNFIIMPLNTKAHSGIMELQNTINEIDSLLVKNNFKVLDMFTPNAKSYEDGVLEDIMHPYNTGWYQMNKFILDNYRNDK